MSRGFLWGSVWSTLDTMTKPVDSQCQAFQTAMQVLGRSWNALILNVLQVGPLRFSELSERAKGPGDKVLSARLKDLEGRGLLGRHVEAGPPPRRCYGLAPNGRTLRPLPPANARCVTGLGLETEPRLGSN